MFYKIKKLNKEHERMISYALLTLLFFINYSNAFPANYNTNIQEQILPVPIFSYAVVKVNNPDEIFIGDDTSISVSMLSDKHARVSCNNIKNGISRIDFISTNQKKKTTSYIAVCDPENIGSNNKKVFLKTLIHSHSIHHVLCNESRCSSNTIKRKIIQ